MVSGKNGGDDGSTSSSTCSDDTNEAFLEMLGLPAAFNVVSMITADDDENDDCRRRGDEEAVKTSVDSERNINSPSTQRNEPPGGGGDDGNGAVISPLEVPRRCSRYLHDPSDVAAFVIDDFLNAAECRRLIRLAGELSGAGFRYVTEAAHTDDEGVAHVVKLREANRHKLSVFEHAPTSDELWRKMEPAILPRVRSFAERTGCGPPLGLNPRLRVLRYDAADRDVFEPHFDATTRVGDMTSLLTVLVYLNDGGGGDFDGGETCYLDSRISTRGGDVDAAAKIAPAAGRVVVFEHDLFHSSAPLKFGTKYVLRTDVLFGVDAQRNGGVGRPRGGSVQADGSGDDAVVDACNTLLEVCRWLSLPEGVASALDEAGLLDLTLESLFAPGVSAMRQVMRDVLDEGLAERLLDAALACRR